MKTFATFCILTLILVFSSCTVDRAELEKDPGVFGNADSSSETDVMLYEMDDTLKHDEPEIITQKVIEIKTSPRAYVEKLLSEHTFFKDNADFESDKYHTILEYPYADNKIAIVAATSAKENDCEDCFAYLSLFLFEQGNGWKMTEKYLQFEDLSTYGNIDFVRSADLERTERSVAGDISIKKVADKHLFVLLNSAYVKGREYEAYSMIFCKTGSEYKNTGVITTEYRNDLKNIAPDKIQRWEGELSFKKSDNNLPDIVVDISGEKKGRNFIDKQVYVFKEDRYIIQN